ncbi:hypothetical protein DICSQDRAFT_72398, partial [Dichomitus squalens LYAD-421 SS1]
TFQKAQVKAHAKLSFHEQVGQILGLMWAPTRMDDQAKFLRLRGGNISVYLRMPVVSGYKENIRALLLNHTTGPILLKETDGAIPCEREEPPHFGIGRTLGENYGTVACGKDRHRNAALKQANVEEG